MNRRITLSAFAAVIAVAVADHALAQAGRPSSGTASYPNGPIRFIVPFAPGSGNDLVSRKIGQLMSESLHQPVVIENQGGAGGVIGIAQLSRAAPNGYTIAMGSPSTLAIGPYMMKDAPYDPMRDVAPITMIAAAPFVLIVNNNLPVNTIGELIAYAKANPGKLNYSSAGIGTTNHLGVEVLKSVAGVDFQHIPFRGAAPAISALIAGQIQMTYGPILQTIPLLHQKQVKALALTAARRSPVLPDLPTVAESGYPGYQSVNWYGMVAPAKTPPAIIDLLNRDIVGHLSTPEIRTQLSNDGAQVYGNTAKEFSEVIRTESERYKKIIKALNLTAQ